MRLLVVVDYQYDFVDGSLGFAEAVALEKPICDKIRAYRENGDDVVYTMDTHEENYLETQEGRKLPVPHCRRGTPGWQLFGEASKELAGCRSFEKETFGSAALFSFLQQNLYDSIELGGVVSNICVISNAVLAKTARPEAEILVDARCTASNDARLNEMALKVMAGLQITVIS